MSAEPGKKAHTIKGPQLAREAEPPAAEAVSAGS
jgi:hypothetical protein